MKEKALKHFRGAERYNCAQAVYKSFEKHGPVDSNKLTELKWAGGGQAKDGLCGALFAAKQLMKDEGAREGARNHFREQGGSIYCREIRRGRRLSCRECVATAAELAESNLK